MDTRIETIDDYIATFASNVQEHLTQIRDTIKKVAPQAGEKISYGMPTFTLNGNLIHFAAYKNHIGLYPAPVALEPFAADLSGYKTSKGAVQFPINKPMPLQLIEKITKFRVEKNLEKKRK